MLHFQLNLVLLFLSVISFPTVKQKHTPVFPQTGGNNRIFTNTR